MKVQVIIGSTRPTRVGHEVAAWFTRNLPTIEGTEYEVIDLATWDLPIFDEPMHPATGQYENDHTKAWSEKVKEADGYVFLTPEYNAGYSAAMKNAIDYLFHEWTNKPVIIAGYGAGGGTTASAQLRQVVERLKMRPTDLSPSFTIGRDMQTEDAQIKDIDVSFAEYASQVQVAGEQLHALLDAAE